MLLVVVVLASATDAIVVHLKLQPEAVGAITFYFPPLAQDDNLDVDHDHEEENDDDDADRDDGTVGPAEA